ncbi:organoarsenical effux MFS transporter ArsJ [Colwellia asteriadis]|uniref:Organoarsenical effux MFS transporter ArsJ n=1 Tax=Colwellia asteriadis TaxID=517723 RepID=A0ABP3WG37_9GAMM
MGLLSVKALPDQVKQYLIITGNYWAFTLTDGALRMLVVLYFHQLGYSAFNIAMLFLFYEIFGVITNLVGGWLGAKLGLNKTMNIGLGLQVAALAMLTVSADMLTVTYVMAAQALSGIAKDLNKMSAKSSIKLLVPDSAQGKLYQWVALLTGSKNALKGVGFFLGGVLLSLFEFRGAIIIMMTLLFIVWVLSLVFLKDDLNSKETSPECSTSKPENAAIKFTQLFSKSKAINVLSAARLFLFGARDVWFVVALPVFLATHFGWDHWWVGTFMASWVIAYGVVQSFAPYFTGKKQGKVPTGRAAFLWASYLTLIPGLIALALYFNFYIQSSLIISLLIFGAVFAINSSLHSYLIVSYARHKGVSLDVGFYYMANAMGRLTGTVLSGWVYQYHGLQACLWISSAMLLVATLLSLALPKSR